MNTSATGGVPLYKNPYLELHIGDRNKVKIGVRGLSEAFSPKEGVGITSLNNSKEMSFAGVGRTDAPAIRSRPQTASKPASRPVTATKKQSFILDKSASNPNVGINSALLKAITQQGNAPVRPMSGITISDNEFNFHSPTEIRKLLHPSMQKNQLGQKDTWVPGNMAQSRPMSGKSNVSNRYYCRYNKEFSQYDPNEQSKPGGVRAFSEYKTPIELEREAQKEKDSKVIGPKVFKATFGIATKPNYIDNYVTRTPSENPSTHAFRELNRSKWITQDQFKLS